MRNILFLSFLCVHALFANPREELLLTFSGQWISRALYVATKLDVADKLESGPKSTEELAKLTGAHPVALGRLLHTLASFGIFQEVKPGLFANSEKSALLLTSSPDSLKHLSLFYGEDVNKAWEELVACIQTGKPAFDIAFNEALFPYLKKNKERLVLFQEAMKEKSKAVIDSVLSVYDFSPYNTIYDIGSGQGSFLGAIKQKYPNMKGLLFDLPEVIQGINTDTFSLVSGDFFKEVPKGGDLYILKSILHDWDDEKSLEILKNCHIAMEDNSRLLIVDVVLQAKDKSQYANCMDLLMLAITGGKERLLTSFEELLDKSGFVLEKIYPTETEFSIIEIKKKRELLSDLTTIYNKEYSYSLPSNVIDSWLLGKGFAESSEYTEQERADLILDIQTIYANMLGKNPVKKLEAVITAGAPGAGKTTKMRADLEGKNWAYVDPDDVSLKQMTRTYLKQIENGDRSKEARKAAYDKWRPGSNASAHLSLAHLIKEKYAFYFGTTSTGAQTAKFFEFLKKQGYQIRLIHITAPDDVRWGSIQQRDKTFVQTTEEDTREKGKLLPERIMDYLKYADRIEFYYRGAVMEEAECAAVWKKGKLRILDSRAYENIKLIHNATVLFNDKLTEMQKKALYWENTVEPSSIIVEGN